MKKTLIATGIITAAFIPGIIYHTVSKKDSMNNYNDLKYQKFWQGNENRTFKYKTNKFSDDVRMEVETPRVKLIPQEEFWNDIEKLNIYSGIERIGQKEIKESLNKQREIDWSSQEQTKDVLIKVKMIDVKEIFYDWKDGYLYQWSSEEFKKWDEYEKKLKKKWQKENQDKWKSDRDFEVEFFKYEGIIFYDLGVLKSIIFNIKNWDENSKLDDIFDEIKSNSERQEIEELVEELSEELE